MKCPSCQAEVQPTTAVCPNCGAFVAFLPRQPAAPAQAETVPAPWAQAETVPLPWAQAETVPAPWAHAETVPLPWAHAEILPAPRAQTETVRAPRPRPRSGRVARDPSGRALFLDFNEKPANIVRVMDEAKRRQGEFVASYWQRLRILLLLLPAGLVFLLLDLLLDYGSISFSLVAYVLWGAALAGWLALDRQSDSTREHRPERPSGGFAESFRLIFALVLLSIWVLRIGVDSGIFAFLAENPFLVSSLILGLLASVALISLVRRGPRGEAFGTRFDGARIIFETLKDDLAPKRTLLGWLDLSGAQQPGKVVRQKTSRSGMPVNYYRDEWLRMKMPLRDGNLLRLSVVERVRAAQGRWKRGSSGKQKWKPGGVPLGRHEVRVAVALDPAAFQLLPVPDGTVDKFQVHVVQSDGGRLELRATTDLSVYGWDILCLLRFAYDHVKPRGAPAATEAPSAEAATSVEPATGTTGAPSPVPGPIWRAPTGGAG